MTESEKLRDLLEQISNICDILKYPIAEDEEQIRFLLEIRDTLLAEYMELRGY